MTLLVEAPTTTFDPPTEATAVAPAEARGLTRDGIRLLVASPAGVTHAHFRDLPDYLSPGDLVVVNNSATIAAQVDGFWLGHGPVVVHAATHLDDGDWVMEIRTAPDAAAPILDAAAGDRFTVDRLTITLRSPYPAENSSPTGVGNRLWRPSIDGDLSAVLAARGRPIAYGYLDRPYPLSAYQAVFSTVPGSAEMPSAGRGFTHEIITRLVANGVAVAPITLHTGVSSQEAGEAPQTEWFDVPAATARLVNSTRATGGRIVAVGTTVTRALESAVDAHGRVAATKGWTNRVLTPNQPPQVVSGLITGWHDPHASHLLLVEAIAGRELAQTAYDHAVAGGYLWHEFGDAGLLLP